MKISEMAFVPTCEAVGTRLVGDEGWGPTVIEITAVGHGLVLARTVGRGRAGFESPWFDLREWTVAP